MSLEDKMKKRQEIQQEIADLNNQLRQHQIEQRKEQQSKGLSMDDMLGGNRTVAKSGNKGSGLSAKLQKQMMRQKRQKIRKSTKKMIQRLQQKQNQKKMQIRQPLPMWTSNFRIGGYAYHPKLFAAARKSGRLQGERI
jgi:hypothetical protein